MKLNWLFEGVLDYKQPPGVSHPATPQGAPLQGSMAQAVSQEVEEKPESEPFCKKKKKKKIALE